MFDDAAGRVATGSSEYSTCQNFCSMIQGASGHTYTCSVNSDGSACNWTDEGGTFDSRGSLTCESRVSCPDGKVLVGDVCVNPLPSEEYDSCTFDDDFGRISEGETPEAACQNFCSMIQGVAGHNYTCGVNADYAACNWTDEEGVFDTRGVLICDMKRVCPDGYEVVYDECQPVSMDCECDELFNTTTSSCEPFPAYTIYEPYSNVLFTHAEPNHNDDISRLPNGEETNRCWELAPETHGTCSNTSTDNPINCATGQKHYTEVDYQGFGQDAVQYTRYYETPNVSSVSDDGDSDALSGSDFWQPNARPTLTTRTFADGAVAKTFSLGNRIERIFFFPAGSNTYQTNPLLPSITLNDDGRTVTLASKQVYEFSEAGVIKQVKDENNELSVIYESALINGMPRITQQRNRFGRYLNYSYDSEGRLSTLTDQDGHQIHYEYDAQGNLSKVVYPDSTPESLDDNPFKEYLFEDPDFPRYITGIVDQESNRIANIAYNDDGKATLSERYNGSERVEVSYPEDGRSVVKFYRDTSSDAYREEHYRYAKFRGQYKLTSKAITQCDNCDVTTETWDYDDRELLIRYTSPAGIVTEWTYDGLDRKVSETVGVGTAEAHTTTYVWNDEHNQIEEIKTASEVTTHRFDASGNITQTQTTPVQ
ncbi:RHS repeat protein [Reinekea blandensis]|nr:RHS repeat protein [Reinekea blandensis]